MKGKGIQVVVGLLVIAGAALLLFAGDPTPDADEMELVELAQCLTDTGTEFYGAFWCPNCENQRRMFGRAGSDALPYIECANPDNSQTEQCAAEGIEAYPTWRFADGTEVTGTQSFETLAELAGCEAPGAHDESEEEVEREVEGAETEIEEGGHSDVMES